MTRAAATLSLPRPIYAVLVVYSQGYLLKAVRELHDILRLATVRYVLVVVANARLDLSSVRSFPCTHFIEGTNSNAEFSGWDEGLAELKRINVSSPGLSPIYLFANDTFCHHRTWKAPQKYLFLCSLLFWSRFSQAGAIGYIDCVPYAFRLYGVLIREWLSTYLFCIKSESLDALQWTLSPSPELLSLLLPPGRFSSDSFFGPGLDQNLKFHLSSWLFKPNQKGSWRGAEPLNESSAAKLFLKARSILSEKLMYAKFKCHSVGVFPVNLMTYCSSRIKCAILRAIDRHLRAPSSHHKS